jgi:DNA-binding FadR family transcriptional regulator
VNRDPAVEAVFQPVRSPTTFEDTVERLGTAIRTGLLVPGTKLPPERRLAEELRISRSTLREALATLVESGHLISHRGCRGGSFVAERPPLSERGDRALGWDARAVLDHRVAIEVGAAMLAAERAQRRELDALDGLVERMARPADFEAHRRADIRFHIGVAEAARSPRLVAEMTEVHGQMSDLIALIAHPEQVLARSNAQHRELVALLREGDGQGAATLMRKHVRGTERMLAGLCDRVLRIRAGDCPPSAKSGADTAWSSSGATPRKPARKRLTAVRTHA